LKMSIPDIKDDETLVNVVDELLYRLKVGHKSDMTSHLVFLMRGFAVKYGLDSDPHNFATMAQNINDF